MSARAWAAGTACRRHCHGGPAGAWGLFEGEFRREGEIVGSVLGEPGVDDHPAAVRSGVDMIGHHAEHPRKPHHELAAIGVRVEGVAVFLHLLGHRRHVSGEPLGELPRRRARRGHRIEFEIAVGTEVMLKAAALIESPKNQASGSTSFSRGPARTGRPS